MISSVKIWRNQKYIARTIGKTGQIISWTVIRVPPAHFSEQAPYAVAVVRLEDGQQITAQVVDCDIAAVEIGQKVITVVRRTMQAQNDAVIPYGVKVKPF